MLESCLLHMTSSAAILKFSSYALVISFTSCYMMPSPELGVTIFSIPTPVPMDWRSVECGVCVLLSCAAQFPHILCFIRIFADRAALLVHHSASVSEGVPLHLSWYHYIWSFLKITGLVLNSLTPCWQIFTYRIMPFARLTSARKATVEVLYMPTQMGELLSTKKLTSV